MSDTPESPAPRHPHISGSETALYHLRLIADGCEAVMKDIDDGENGELVPSVIKRWAETAIVALLEPGDGRTATNNSAMLEALCFLEREIAGDMASEEAQQLRDVARAAIAMTTRA